MNESQTVQTTRLNDGRIVLAKPYDGQLTAYANIAQANRKALELGEDWCVTGNRPYYVTSYRAVEGPNALTAFRAELEREMAAELPLEKVA